MLISKEEAKSKIRADKIKITDSLLAVGADKAVYEAINKTCDRHVRMLEELPEKHGRLIDVDVLLKYLIGHEDLIGSVVASCTQTVIEAERE